MTLNSSLDMFVILFISLTTFANAHTWIEQMNVIAPNGTFVGAPGFVRGNVLRTNPSFSDTAMTNLIPPNGRSTGNEILSTDPMCMPSQQSQTQTDGSPRLQAAAGDAVALRYQENGHVTLPNNQPGKPANRGTVFVYGTTQPSSSDTLLGIHKVWNAAGTGGDGRGVLLSSQNFDDGQCYQVNSSPISAQRQQQFPHTADNLMGINMWCQQDIQLPSNAPSGQPYTLYWVWDWPTAPGVDPGVPNGKQELYTTCMDVDVIASNGNTNTASAGFVQGQDLNSAAIPSEFAELSNPTAVAAPSEPAISNGAPGTGIAPTPQPTQPTVATATQGAATSQPPQGTIATSANVAASSQATSTGFGGNGGGSFSRTRTTFAVVTNSAGGETSSDCPNMTPAALTAPSAPGQAGPSQAIVPGASTETVTQYASVTQTVFHTMYPSGINQKRTLTQTIIASPAAPSSSATSSSKSPEFELRGRVARSLRW